MASNIQITEGAGKTISTDEVSGAVHIQRFKLALGAAGDDDGSVEEGNPLPVTQGSVEASYDAMVKKAYSFFSGTQQAIGILDSGSALKFNIWNDTDANMIGSLDGGSTDHFVIPARCAKTINLGELGRKESADLYMKYESAPTTGNVYFEVIK
jgi:hypothetical protein